MFFLSLWVNVMNSLEFYVIKFSFNKFHSHNKNGQT